MKAILICSAIMFTFITSDLAGAAGAKPDEILARIEAIEKENALLRKEVVELRKLTASRSKSAAMHEREQGLKRSSPSKPSLDAYNSNSTNASKLRSPNQSVPTYLEAKAQSSRTRSWTGLYGGLHVGQELANATGVESAQGYATGAAAVGYGGVVADQAMRGWLAGMQIGANIEYNRAVIGAEITGSSSKLSDSKSATPGSGASSCFKDSPLGGGVSPKSLTCNSKTDWTAQFLVRAGYTFWDGNLLPYLKGGIALSQLDLLYQYHGSSCVSCILSAQWGAKRTLIGGVFGAGLEISLSDKLSVGAEYLFAQYASQPFSSVETGILSNGMPKQTITVSTSNHSLNTQTAQFFMNYKLN